MTEANLSVADTQALLALFGTRDQHVRQIRDALGVKIFARDEQVHVEGAEEAVTRAMQVLEALKRQIERAGLVTSDDVARSLEASRGRQAPTDAPIIDVLNTTRKVVPRTAGQIRYVQAIDDNDCIFCCGPAGTGKTYLAVAKAVEALKRERVRKIVLVRPAVEAGESLGYLPGDLKDKINPYLRPLLDGLAEMIDFDQMKRFNEQGVIEVAPLAYMRGRTLNEAFIILDEAQNTTISQMKMFLTRMGHKSKIVVSGDPTQVDLPSHTASGLNDALRRLRGINGLTHVTLSQTDIVRHRLVQEIVRAYEEGTPRHA